MVAALAVVLCLSGATVASAAFTDRDTASQTFRTATLEPPTSVAAAHGTCTIGVSDAIVLMWIASVTTTVNGYEILRATASGGPYTAIGTVTGRTVETYIDTPLAFATSYHYVIRSIKGSWRSVQTAPVSLTTRSSHCL